MKCALEFAAIAAVATATRENAIAYKKTHAKQAAINFCEETISEMLERAALDGKTTIKVELGLHRWGDFYGFYTTIQKQKDIEYADGSPSYELNQEHPPMELEAMVEYLRQNCYQVTVHKTHFKLYGCGYQPMVELYISLPATLPCL